MNRSFLALSGLSLTLFLTGAGCSDADPAPPVPEVYGTVDDALVDVEQSAVKYQSVGNCWLYANASWAESLHKSVAGEELDISESYWTYWHWFDQIARGNRLSGRSEVSTAGSWRTGTNIAARYGWMLEGDFLPSETAVIRSARQAAALIAINTSLKSGALATDAARANPATVRAELDTAFGLDATVKGWLDQAFGTGVTRTLSGRAMVPVARGATAPPIKTVYELSVKVPKPSRVRAVAAQGAPLALDTDYAVVRLADIIGLSSQSSYNWREVGYPTTAARRRPVQQVIQRALHDRQPVIMSWFVDFNYRTNGGTVFDLPDPRPAPGDQGGHLIVLEDYQVDTKGPTGVLALGAWLDPADPANLPSFQAALAPGAELQRIRIKNSWGTHRGAPAPGFAGYHDLTMAYLDTTLPKNCADESTPEAVTACEQNAPAERALRSFVVPAGY